MGQSFLPNQNINNNMIGRKTTFAHNTNNSSFGVVDGVNIQLTRSPSQPNYENIGLK